MKTVRRAALAACVFSITSLGAAHADLKVVQHTIIKNPQLTAMMQSMSPQQRAAMSASGAGSFLSGAPVVSTIYAHGTETRVDIGPTSSVMNSATHQIVTINRLAHTYSVSTYNPASKTSIHAAVHATDQTKIVLGHRTREYTVKISNPQGGEMTGDIWSAPDLPQPPAALFSAGPASALQGEFAKVKGLPLLVTMQITGTPIGSTTIRSVTISISRAPIPAAVFSIPRGFTKVVSAQPMGMGGGLP